MLSQNDLSHVDIQPPERVFWAKEVVVGAVVEVVTGLHALLLRGYGRQNLKAKI